MRQQVFRILCGNHQVGVDEFGPFSSMELAEKARAKLAAAGAVDLEILEVEMDPKVFQFRGQRITLWR